MIGKIKIGISGKEPAGCLWRKTGLFAAEIDRLEQGKILQCVHGLFSIRIVQAGQIKLCRGVFRGHAAGKVYCITYLDQRMPLRPGHQFRIAGAAAEVGGNQRFEPVQEFEILGGNDRRDALGVVFDGGTAQSHFLCAAAEKKQADQNKPGEESF